jgi:hypothetical protein
LFKWTFKHQCEELCNTFISMNQYVWHHIMNVEQVFKKTFFCFMVYNIIAK